MQRDRDRSGSFRQRVGRGPPPRLGGRPLSFRSHHKPNNNMSPIPAKARAVVCQAQGGVEELRIEEVDVRACGPDEVLLRVEWTGERARGSDTGPRGSC